jgi:hypothetical protein
VCVRTCSAGIAQAFTGRAGTAEPSPRTTSFIVIIVPSRWKALYISIYTAEGGYGLLLAHVRPEGDKHLPQPGHHTLHYRAVLP